MRIDRADDVRGFAWVIGVSLVCLAGLALVVVQLARIDALAHVWGLVERACTSLPHVTLDLLAFLLALVPTVVLTVLMLSAIATYRRTALLVKSLEADLLPVVPEPVRLASKRARLGADQVLAIDCPDLLVFVHGFLRPRVMISTAVIEQLSQDELVAVLAHEGHHVRRFDPARRMVADVLAKGLFLFPVIAELRDHFFLTSEIAADDSAMRRSSRKDLARAIVKFADAPTLAVVPGMSSHPDVGERIAHVVDPERDRPALVATRASIGLTAVNGAVLAVLAYALPFFPEM